MIRHTGTMSGAERLTELVMADDVSASLWAAHESGELGELVPEFPRLAMEQDPVHRHKDVLAHTIAVVAKTRPDLLVRLGAFFHDIAKPDTRKFENGNVTFKFHEAVGARMTRKRLLELGYEESFADDVARLVEISGRFHGYDGGWTDSAVRRYARDAGHLLGALNHLVRCDCTTRNLRKVDELQHRMDDLEYRISELAREDAERRERPDLDGTAIMEHLGLEPGPLVGKARAHLLALKKERGELSLDEAYDALDKWAADEGLA